MVEGAVSGPSLLSIIFFIRFFDRYALQVAVFSTDPKQKPPPPPPSAGASPSSKPSSKKGQTPKSSSSSQSNAGTHKHVAVAQFAVAGGGRAFALSIHLSAGGRSEAESNRIKELWRIDQLISHFHCTPSAASSTAVTVPARADCFVVAGDFNFRSALNPAEPLRAPESRMIGADWKECLPSAHSYSNTFDPTHNPLAQKLSRSGLAGQFDHVFVVRRGPALSTLPLGSCQVVVTQGECSDHYPVLAHVAIAATDLHSVASAASPTTL